MSRGMIWIPIATAIFCYLLDRFLDICDVLKYYNKKYKP